MKQKIYISLLLIILCGSSLFGQLKYTFTQFGHESWEFLKQPTKWDGNDWLTLGVISAGTFLLMETVDQPVRTAVLKDRRYYKSFPIEFGRIYGDLYSPCVLFGGFAIHSLITDDIGTRKIAYEIGQASLYAGALTFLLKLAIGRSRPYMNEGTTSFHPFSSIFINDDHSFPGGHTTAAFVLSTVLSRNAKPVWLKVLAYVPAALTFFSRIYQDKHWTSDDFLGGAIGYFIATWVVDKHENNKSLVEISSTYPLSIRIAL
ncbi:MAG: phosphatase PAP2 family protein [Ignavibacteriales bacterium]|nr:MAG: phosphatase PAP2 family protein [Ignavibacteriales bacterium]